MKTKGRPSPEATTHKSPRPQIKRISAQLFDKIARSNDQDCSYTEAMPQLIAQANRIPVPGNKIIDEYVGRVNSGESQASVAHMRSPAGWSEPGQRPEFDEFTLVLGGMMRVEYEGGVMEARAGQAIVTRKGEWIRYSTPEGAEYVAVCIPAFAPDTVHRDE
jgi:quercetin dioxygenase-like cupin family protein